MLDNKYPKGFLIEDSKYWSQRQRMEMSEKLKLTLHEEPYKMSKLLNDFKTSTFGIKCWTDESKDCSGSQTASAEERDRL